MIIPNKKLKIALIGFRLGIGGSEKVMANLSLFFEKNGIEVHIIILENDVDYPYAGKLINIGLLKNKRNDIFNKLKRLSALRKHLKQNSFDYIIDFRFRPKIIQEYILIKWIYNTKTIFTVHSYLINIYLPKNDFLTRFFYSKAFAVISITKKMENLIKLKYQLDNVQTIYNPINLEEIESKKRETISIDFKYVIAVGQFTNPIKQFDKLIECYAKSILPSQNIYLIILGDGDLKSNLQKVALQYQVSDKVIFLGHITNPYAYISRAKYLVLCSKNEGMPNVILEALACGTPVISFDCDSGPSEMIVNKYNGLLVENQDWNKLVYAMNLFLKDDELYQFCKKNTIKSTQLFSLENIGKKWLNLLHTTKK